MTNREIKELSSKQFTDVGKWTDIGTIFVYNLLAGAASYSSSSSSSSSGGTTEEELKAELIVLIVILIFAIATFFYVGPLIVGRAKYLLDGTRKGEKRFESLFSGFKDNYWRNVGAYALNTLYVFLWTLLFIIPGIIKSYAYSMTYYILQDNPELTVQEALDKSEKLMNGHKWELFCLNFSFIGWQLLNILTLGLLGIFKINPWMAYSETNFYNNLVGKFEENKVDIESEVLDA